MVPNFFPFKTHSRCCCVFFSSSFSPKMKILSSFTHPQVVANLHEFLSSAEQKGRYFEERLEQLFGTVDFHDGRKILAYWKPKFQSFFLCVQQKNESHTGCYYYVQFCWMQQQHHLFNRWRHITLSRD